MEHIQAIKRKVSDTRQVSIPSEFGELPDKFLVLEPDENGEITLIPDDDESNDTEVTQQD